MGEKNTFLIAKNALLEYYSSAQTDQVARLIGFSIALFTLVEVIRGSQELSLSSIFSGISSAIPNVLPGVHWVPEVLKFLLLFSSMWVLIYAIVRAVIRFSIFAYYANAIQSVRQEEIEIKPVKQEEKKSVEWKEIKLEKISREEFLARYKLRIPPDYSLHTRIVCTAQNVIAAGIYERNTRIFFLPLRYFFSPECNKPIGNPRGWGRVFYIGFPILITGLLMWFLW